LPGRRVEFVGDDGQGWSVLETLLFEEFDLLMARHAGQFEAIGLRLENLQGGATDAACGTQDCDFLGPVHALCSGAERETLVASFERPILQLGRPWVKRSRMIRPARSIRGSGHWEQTEFILGILVALLGFLNVKPCQGVIPCA
jgi:hypothetical protein